MTKLCREILHKNYWLCQHCITLSSTPNLAQNVKNLLTFLQVTRRGKVSKGEAKCCEEECCCFKQQQQNGLSPGFIPSTASYMPKFKELSPDASSKCANQWLVQIGIALLKTMECHHFAVAEGRVQD